MVRKEKDCTGRKENRKLKSEGEARRNIVQCSPVSSLDLLSVEGSPLLALVFFL